MYWKRNAKNKKLLIVRINILFFVNLKINIGAKNWFLITDSIDKCMYNIFQGFS